MRSRAQWHELFSQQKSDGKSAIGFCQDNSICPNYFSIAKSHTNTGVVADSEYCNMRHLSRPNPKPAATEDELLTTLETEGDEEE